MRDLTVWIIENEPLQNARAETVIKQVGEQHGKFNLDIRSSRSWDWPPTFKGAAQEVSLQLPDLVVLDLYDDQLLLKGDKFYKNLRTAENQPRAFVIVWSGYTGQREAEKFVKENVKTDRRLVPLEIKALVSLEDAVRGCLEQIEEEE